TSLACAAVVSQRADSRSASGRLPCGIVTSPWRVQSLPPTSPRQCPVSASTAIMACRSTPKILPLPTSQATAIFWRGGKLDVAGVLDRQHVTIATCYSRLGAPALDQLVDGDAR